ncbi:unnamed protein product [Mytilus edulis]|uniref:Uncharacterized protein n=1 Tax=Mytilus edulis TaxID=6550 RepID=A0A8S3TEZ4_MYTED|nr:unnamed protein product [Mytilus edulis]
MEDDSNLECVSDFSTGSFTIDNRKHQLWNALNVQKDLIFRQCTTIIQVVVTILKLLQDKHDPKKILDKEHLRRSEYDFQLVVRLLTDGLKKMKDFSMECRAPGLKIQAHPSQILNAQNQNKHGKLEEIFSPDDRCTNGDCSEDLDDSNGSCGYLIPHR